MKVRQLQECTALLTGATASIALECAAQLAEAGVPRIMINGRNQERGQSAVATIKARAPDCDVRFFSGDPTSYSGAEEIVEAAIEAFGASCKAITRPVFICTPEPDSAGRQNH